MAILQTCLLAITQQESKIYIYWLEIWWPPGVVITTNFECKKQIVNCIEHQKSKNWTNTVFYPKHVHFCIYNLLVSK
jgi:hypothetical protein